MSRDQLGSGSPISRDTERPVQDLKNGNASLKDNSTKARTGLISKLFVLIVRKLSLLYLVYINGSSWLYKARSDVDKRWWSKLNVQLQPRAGWEAVAALDNSILAERERAANSQGKAPVRWDEDRNGTLLNSFNHDSGPAMMLIYNNWKIKQN